MADVKDLLVEALNFDSTIFDTNQISIIRGGSLLALNAIKTLARGVLQPHKLISGGASRGFLRLSDNTDRPTLLGEIDSVLNNTE